MSFKAIIFLLPLMAALALGIPLKAENEAREVRKLVYDPTANTEFQTRVGDVTYFTKAYMELLREERSHKRDTRNARANKDRLWENCVIPYQLDERYSENGKRTILQGMAHWEENTCVRFVNHTDEPDYIYVYPGPGCSSFVGRASGEQLVSIGTGCFSFSSILHELGHVIGFYHEHNRPDRDDYINIIEENIEDSFVAFLQFRKKSYSRVNLLGVGYDYNSIMHYDSDFFSSHHSLDTIVAHDENITVGMAVELSEFDILKTNLLCGCSNSTKDHPPRTTVVPEVPEEDTKIPPHQFLCGEVFDGVESGTIISPDFGDYPLNADCEWSIRVREGYQVAMEVYIDMEYSSDCTEDYLQLRDSFDRDRFPSGNWCYNDYHFNPISTTNIAYLRFHTNAHNRFEGYRGFTINFWAQEHNECESGLCSHGCTNSPGSYECSCPDGFYLSADQHTCFDVNECALNKGGCDHFCVNRGGHFYCECEDGYSLLSDGKTCAKGDVIDPCLVANCGYSCVVIPGVPMRARCICPKGFTIDADGVTCVDENECETDNGGCEGVCVNTEGSYECGCTEGYELSNCFFCKDFNECSVLNGGCETHCTNTEGSYLCSCDDLSVLRDDGHGCNLQIAFNIRSRILRPSILSSPLCGELERTDSVGSIQTPNWPETYPVDIECEWVIKAPSECQIMLDFDPSSFGIAGRLSNNCSKDYLKVYDNTGALMSPPICDLQLPGAIESTGVTSLHFFSGPYHGPRRTGFKINYKTICPVITLPPTTAQPTTLPTTVPTTAEPTTPPTTVPTTAEPTTPPTTVPTTAEPTTLPTTVPTTAQPTTPPTTVPTPLPSTAPPSRCPQESLTASSGTITSPNYPSTYPVNLNLEWHICCPSANRIKFSFDSNFWLGGQLVQGCPKDWIKVFTGTSKQETPTHGPYCFSESPADFVVQSSDALVAFYAGAKHHPTRIGFSLTYQCV